MGLFRRKADEWSDAKQQMRTDKLSFVEREIAKYQAKLDELVAAGKGESGQASRIRKVIARNERMRSELS